MFRPSWTVSEWSLSRSVKYQRLFDSTSWVIRGLLPSSFVCHGTIVPQQYSMSGKDHNILWCVCKWILHNCHVCHRLIIILLRGSNKRWFDSSVECLWMIITLLFGVKSAASVNNHCFTLCVSLVENSVHQNVSGLQLAVRTGSLTDNKVWQRTIWDHALTAVNDYRTIFLVNLFFDSDSLRKNKYSHHLMY